MSEEVKEEKKPEKKKGLFAKAKDALLPDQEEQAAIISTFVRMGVLVWSGGILTLNYVVGGFCGVTGVIAIGACSILIV